MTDRPDMWIDEALLWAQVKAQPYQAPTGEQPRTLYAVRAELTPVDTLHRPALGTSFVLRGVAQVGLHAPEWGTGDFTHSLAWDPDVRGVSFRVEIPD